MPRRNDHRRGPTWTALAIIAVAIILIAAFGCAPHRDDARPLPDPITLRSSDATVTLTFDPTFVMSVENADGRTVLSTLPAEHAVKGDKLGAYAGLGATRRTIAFAPVLVEGYDHHDPTDEPWLNAATAVEAEAHGRSATVVLIDPSEPDVRITLNVKLDGSRVDVEASADADRTDEERSLNLFGQAFRVSANERFVGLGQREASIDHRGRHYQNWVEEGGVGGGEAAAPGPDNPFPNGPGMTHVPIPFLMSSGGYGLWIRTSFRSAFALGSDDPEAIRIESEEPRLRYRLYVHEDPRDTLDAFTEDTGRARLPAPWVFGPRRRMDANKLIGDTLEAELMRQRKVPTTIADDTTHFLPNNSSAGKEEERREWTARLHRLGYKAMGYFNGHVSVTHPEAEPLLTDGRAKDVFMRMEDGSEAQTLLSSGGWQTVVTLDFTKPHAVRWFEERMGHALSLGYDGWMLDFGEYLSPNVRLANGMTGLEAHNLYPLMLQQAATDFLRRERGDDFLYYSRSGYTGTQAIAPTLWSGDPSASFDDARGLAAHVRAGLNVGLSGVPFWGSDISGFTCVNDPPADKEVYLRWAEFGAFSPSMHDDNACVGRKPEAPPKWTLWSDDETTEVYARYASLHTRLFPYAYAAARQATLTGMPLMRHPLLMHPELPEAWDAQHEYWYGPSLYVAPVVRRGERQRSLWLPPGTWFDWWTLAAQDGGRTVTRDAPLDLLPLWFRAGSIIPMLAPDVQTLADAEDPSVVDMGDRDGEYDVRVALAAGGSVPAATARASLVDGTAFSADLATGTLTLPIGFAAASEQELLTCTLCGRIDPLPDGVTRIRVNATGGSVSVGGLTLSASRADKQLTVRWDVLLR